MDEKLQIITLYRIESFIKKFFSSKKSKSFKAREIAGLDPGVCPGFDPGFDSMAARLYKHLGVLPKHQWV